MKYISWNVNGIRACIKKGFNEFVEQCDPDILCIQETKANEAQVDLNFPLYEQYWNSAEKAGYSGTLVLTKHTPLNVKNGMGLLKHDTEGRIITLEFETHFLVTVYTPNAKRDLSRLDYRTNEWDVDFLQYVIELEQSKPVVFCGDLNVAHTELDLANPQSNKTTITKPGNAGFTNEERAGINNIFNAGFIDTFREYTKGNGHYTWWSYMFGARKKNVGWRIDYFCTSKILKQNLKHAFILPEVIGSDHCPVGIEIEF